MGKKNKKRKPYFKATRNRLDNIRDTSETFADTSVSAEEYNKVDEAIPIFKGGKQRAVDLGTIKTYLKIISAVAGVFITLVIPSVWYFSKQDAKVSSIKEDVTELKQTTKANGEMSIKNSFKIDNNEKEIGKINTAIKKIHTLEKDKKPSRKKHK